MISCDSNSGLFDEKIKTSLRGNCFSVSWGQRSKHFIVITKKGVLIPLLS